jgi:hypothetical protein
MFLSAAHERPRPTYSRYPFPPFSQVLEHWLGMAGAIKMKAKEVTRFRERYADGARTTPYSDDDDSEASSDEDDGK